MRIRSQARKNIFMSRHFLHRIERGKSFIYDENILFIYDVENASFIPTFAKWQAELKGLEKKIEKSQDDQERLEELKENICRENIRLANEQVLLTIQAMKHDMKINLMNPL